MAEEPIRDGQPTEDDLFEAIQRFLAEQTGDELDADLRAAYDGARRFVQQQLQGRPELARLLLALERLIESEFPGLFTAPVRSRLAEMLYTYGIAHLLLLQGQRIPALPITPEPYSEAEDEEEDDGGEARPLVIYDLWFPHDVALEQAEDGYYLHVSDGRIDLALYLGEEPNERGALTDLLNHLRYARAHTPPGEPLAESDRITPVLTVELDYSGSELVEANDHVDILFLDPDGEPIVRMHARAAELQLIVEELQATGPDRGL